MEVNEFWKNRNVFVTGATGILGSWLVKDLVEKGAEVTILIRDWVPKSNLIWSGVYDKINTIHGELENYGLLERTLNEYEINTCFHLAAQTIVPTANRNPLSSFESNIKGTWNLLEAIRRNELVKRVVIASTDKVYGEHKELPYKENMPLLAKHPYDVSKACADMLAQSYSETYDIPLSITRCGNIYGGGDLNYNRLVPGTIRSLFFNQAPILRSDGSPKRDYLYVEDITDAYVRLAESVHKRNVKGEVFNFGLNNPMTVLELTDKIISLHGNNVKPEILGGGTPSGEIKDQYLSSEKAERIINWKPRYGLEKGLEKTIEWYTAYFKSMSGKRNGNT